MPRADFDTREVGRDQRRGDAVFVLIAHQVIRVVEFECEPEHGCDRSESDVALVPVQPDTRRLFAVPRALAHDAGIDQRRGIGTGLRRGQGETRNLVARREPRQPALLLFFGAVGQQ